MAFKMKNPSMGKMVKAAGDSRAAAKMKSEESPMKMGKKSPMEKDKDFGVEGSAMKFKKIGSKIKDKLAERKAKRNKSATAEDPDAKGKKQNVAETGIVKDTKRSKGTRSGEKIKEFQVGVDGETKAMSKVKTRGRSKYDADGNLKKSGKIITKTVDADGNKVKTITDGVTGEVLKEKNTKRKGAGETVAGKAAKKKVAKARKYDDANIDKKNKPISEYNAKELAAYNKKIADAKARGLTVDTSEQDDPSPVEMKKRSGLKMKKRSPMKEDGKVVKSTTLTKDEETNTTTTPGSNKPTEKILPSDTPEKKAAYAEYLKNETPEQKENRLKREGKTTTTTTTPAEKETITLKEKELIKAKREEGKFNTVKVKSKKKKKRRGSGTEKITLRDKIRNTFRKKQKPNMCP